MNDYALVDFQTRTVHAGMGEVLPLAAWWNDDGECDWEDATCCSAGPDVNGLFLQIDLTKRGYDQ